MIWIPNQLIGAAIGKDVTLECITEAMPKAISYWVYNGTMVIMTSTTSTFFVQFHEMALKGITIISIFR